MTTQSIAPAGGISRTITIALSATILSLSGVFAFASETAPADAPYPAFEMSSSPSFSSSISGGSVGGSGGSLGG